MPPVFLDWRIRTLNTSIIETQAKSFWFPSCKFKSNTSMPYASSERINLILISCPCVCFGGFHTHWNWLEVGGEKAVMSRHVPSASLGHLGEAVSGLLSSAGGRRLDEKQRQSIPFWLKHGREGGVLHAVTLFRTWSWRERRVRAIIRLEVG